MNPSDVLKRAGVLLYPRECASCGADLEWDNGDYLCSACRGEVEEIAPPLCRVCGLPVPGDARVEVLCRDCRGTRRPFRRARSVLYYRGAVQAWVKAFKYRPALWLGPALSRTLANGFRRFYEAGSVDVVVPVPLFRRREKERGFNQARVLASALARDLKVPVAARALVRRRDTATQALL
nr:double zinc ribbon domain-containing protein [bacterium]